MANTHNNAIIIGAKYNKLTVLEKDKSSRINSHHTYYICRCDDCGWVGSIRGDNIKTYGSAAKCNCKKTHNLPHDTKSIIGNEYNDLKVIGFGKFRKGKPSLWKCQCKCGNIIFVTKSRLEHGITKHCRECAVKLSFKDSRKYNIHKGDIICNNDDPDRSITILDYDHYNTKTGKHYWKWKCNFCGNEGVTAEYGLRNYKFICQKCAIVVNVKRIQKKFARLTPIKLVNHNGQLKWLCKCDCGNTTIVSSSALQYGAIQSCGCIVSQEVRAVTPIENYPKNLKGRLQAIYTHCIKDRCCNPNSKAYESYSKLGICDRWSGKDGCKNFVNDMIATYQPHMTIDRIDNSKGYSPENCRWVSNKDQHNNKSTNRHIVYNSVEYQSVQLLLDEFIESGKLSLADARSKSAYICGRLGSGWSIDEALMIPPESYQHPDTVHNGRMSYKDEWQKAHPDVDLSKLDRPIKSAIVFNKDRKTDYFEDTAKTDRRNMYYNILTDPDLQ